MQVNAASASRLKSCLLCRLVQVVYVANDDGECNNARFLLSEVVNKKPCNEDEGAKKSPLCHFSIAVCQYCKKTTK